MVAKAVHDHHNLGGSNRLLPLAEAAEFLGVTPRALRRHRQEWGIPWVPVGRAIKFRERDLNVWSAKRTVAA